MPLMWQGQQEHTSSDIFTNSIIKQGSVQMWKIVDGGGSISLLLYLFCPNCQSFLREFKNLYSQMHWQIKFSQSPVILITFSAAERNIPDKSI